MADSKAISQLTTAESTSPSDLFETAIPAPSGVQSSTGYVSRKVSATEMGQLLNGTMQYANQLETENKTIIGAINEAAQSGGGGGASYTDITGILEAGETEITLEDEAITEDSTLDFYTDAYGVNPISVSVITGSVTLEFNEQDSDLGVKVRVS